MRIFQRFPKYLLLLSGINLLYLSAAMPVSASSCPEAALSQIVNHRAQAGETVSTIASQYGLLPETLIAMNPNLPPQGAVSTGQVIEVPPFNGVVVSGSGQTWQSLAERHGTRADLLFEINGCPSALPNRVFIPGMNRIVTATAPTSLDYPLPNPAKLILSYGWQPHPQRDELVFNSGIAFAVTSGTEVTSAANGTVAFVGEQNGALLVVVNHRDGLQTRYGNLGNVDFRVGDSVDEGTSLGTVVGESAESFMYFEIRTNSREGWVAQDPSLYLSELDLQQ
ncbi:MAG: M23 family metallopeptidase [Cyanobacteria bacterium P01_F01_bin.116]